jgi:hypothetical protein
MLREITVRLRHASVLATTALQRRSQLESILVFQPKVIKTQKAKREASDA